MWTHNLQTCTYACNSFESPALNRLSPFQLTYGRPPNVLLETNPQGGTSGLFKECNELLRKQVCIFSENSTGLQVTPDGHDKQG